MSLRAYARRRGTSAPSVLRAISRGRLKDCLVLVNGVAQIADPELADREWEANTDLSRAPGYVKERAAGVTSPSVTPGSREFGRVSPLTEASTSEKVWKAKIAELEYRERAGELIEAKAAGDGWAETGTRVCTKLLGVSSRVKARLPELTLAQVAVIDDEIRAALTEIADGKIRHS